MVSIPVALGARSYDVHVGRDILGRLVHWVRPEETARAGFLCDDGVPFSLMDRAARALESAGFTLARVNIRAGEASKCLSDCEVLLERLVAGGLDRGSLLFVMGGGMATDLGGLCAALLFRGVSHVLLPTTLLAQVDAAVGGKTGVNLRLGKNLAGAFWQPRLVVADVAALETLPERELRGGLAETLKALLIGDPPMLDRLEVRASDALAGEPALLEELIAAAVRVKADIIARDERETGGRRIFLNLGHTVGHALEASSLFDLRHGEAVSLGMVAALRVGRNIGLTPPALERRVVRLLEALGLPVDLDTYDESALEPVAVDKKRTSSKWSFVCMRAPGDPVAVELSAGDLRRNLRP